MTTLATARIFVKVPGVYRSGDDPRCKTGPSERLRFPFVRHLQVGHLVDNGGAGFPRFTEKLPTRCSVHMELRVDRKGIGHSRKF
jgi:hypothetical protein